MRQAKKTASAKRERLANWVREEARCLNGGGSKSRNPPTATGRNSAVSSRSARGLKIPKYVEPDNFECVQNSGDATDGLIAQDLRRWGVGAQEVSSLLVRVRDEVLRRVRWAPCEGLAADEDGRDPKLTGKPMVAITIKAACAVADESSRHHAYYASQDILRDLLDEPLSHWELNPLRVRRDVIHLLNTAIRRLGGERPLRRGGWQVSQTGGRTP